MDARAKGRKQDEVTTRMDAFPSEETDRHEVPLIRVVMSASEPLLEHDLFPVKIQEPSRL